MGPETHYYLGVCSLKYLSVINIMGTWTHEWMDCGLFDQHHPFVRKGSPNVVILTYNMAYTLYTVNNFNSNTLKNYLTALVIFWSYFHNFRASSDFLGHILVIFPIFWSYLWSYFHYFGHILVIFSRAFWSYFSKFSMATLNLTKVF